AARVYGRVTGARCSTIALVAIHPAIGRRQQSFVAIAVVWKHCHARTHHHRDADVGLHLEPDAVDRLLQLAPLALSLFSAAPGDYDDELVASVAYADVIRTDRVAEDASHFAQRAIADMVPERVVDVLELV